MLIWEVSHLVVIEYRNSLVIYNIYLVILNMEVHLPALFGKYSIYMNHYHWSTLSFYAVVFKKKQTSMFLNLYV